MQQISLSSGLLLLAACSSAASPTDLLHGSAGTAAPSGAMAGAGLVASGGNGSRPNAQGAAGAATAGRGVVGSTGAAGAAGTSGQGAAGTVATAGRAAGTSGQAAAGTLATAGRAAGTGGQMATAGSGAAGSGASTAGSVTVEFTTVSYGGEYAPLNYGAVWFEGSNKTFIKTATRWAGVVHATDLATWTAASGGWGSLFGGGNMADQMDAMSSATLRTHQKHTVTWNMKDTQKQVVPNGDYVAVLEVTEDRALIRSGPVARIPFTKGPDPQTVNVPDDKSFTGVVLHYTP